MPTPHKIDPSQLRERGLTETDEQYAARMENMARRDSFFERLVTPESKEKKNGIGPV